MTNPWRFWRFVALGLFALLLILAAILFGGAPVQDEPFEIQRESAGPPAQ